MMMITTNVCFGVECKSADECVCVCGAIGKERYSRLDADRYAQTDLADK